MLAARRVARYTIGMATSTARALNPVAELDDIARIFGISETGLGRLFRVERQSVSEWRKKGVPLTRRASVERVADLARALEREIVPSRIPEVVNTKDKWLDGRSILETIAIGGPEPVYGYLHRLFAYGGA